MRRGCRLSLVLALVLCAPGTAAAQWIAVPSQSTTDSGNDARVRNDEGAELRIWLDPDNRLWAMFRLPGGLLALDPVGCPTFQIDRGAPENLAAERHECTAEGDRARLVLAQASDGKVDSPTLLELMNGSRLEVRYRLAHAGYGAMRFSLRGSKQALTSALGDGLSVVGE